MTLELSKLGSGFTEPIAKVANNLIDKVGLAVGWAVKPRGINEAKIVAQKSIISEIAHRDDINPIEKYAIIDNIQGIIKRYKNQNDVLEQALIHLHPTAEPTAMDDDWVSFFFEKAQYVSDKTMQIVWAKLLAEEANSPNSFSKNLMHILSIMSKSDANSFVGLVPFCAHDEDSVQCFIYWDEEQDFLESRNITFSKLINLERLGLIKFELASGFAIGLSDKEEELLLDFPSKRVKVNIREKDLNSGSVLLTTEGEQLFRLCDKVFDKEAYEMCIRLWQMQGFECIEI